MPARTPVTQALLRKYSQVFPVGSAGTRHTDRLIARRQAHLKELDSFAVFSGVFREPGSEHIWIMSGLRIFQEPALIHLTGINQPKVILVLNPKGKGKEKEVLFISKKDPAKEFWDGVRFGYPKDPTPEGKRDLQELQALTGIRDVRPFEEFPEYFRSLVKSAPKPFGYGFYHSYNPKVEGGKKIIRTRTDYNWEFKEQLEKAARKSGRKGFEIRSCVDLHFRLRLPLEPEQIKDAEIAVHHTGEAFAETLAAMDTFQDENELSAHLEYGMKKRSPSGLSFPNIVASGKNATILHYLKNDEPIVPGSLVLLDFGVRYGTMHADITRTVPHNGRYNPLQALLYGIVLDANKETQKNARPGETIRNLNKKTWQFLEEQLQARFFSRGGKAMRSYLGQPHGVSHLMGEQEHDGDPHRIYQDYPLQVGWQISNEPGLYGHFAVTLDGRKYSEWIGIRVEDDLLITKTGCRNLCAEVPKEIGELEGLLAGRAGRRPAGRLAANPRA
jgi:Xaa-Pro aminopeptidase